MAKAVDSLTTRQHANWQFSFNFLIASKENSTRSVDCYTEMVTYIYIVFCLKYKKKRATAAVEIYT